MVEGPRRIGRMRRLAAAGAATLALAGCADTKPSQQPTVPSQTLSVATLNCDPTPRDTRTLVESSKNPHGKGIEIELYRCMINLGTPGSNTEPTKMLLINQVESDETAHTIDNAIAPPPNDEHDKFFGQLNLNSIDACLVVKFDTSGYKFSKVESSPCPTPTLVA